jgi:hypothetical protein
MFDYEFADFVKVNFFLVNVVVIYHLPMYSMILLIFPLKERAAS